MGKRDFLFKLYDKLERFKLKFFTKYNLIRYCFIFEKNSSKNVSIKNKIRINPFHYNKLRIYLEDEVYIEKYVTFQGTGNIKIGKYSSIGERTTIGSSELIEIGKFVQIASNCSIRNTDHKFEDLTKPIAQQGIVTKKVIIEDDVWIGNGVTITKGVKIGKGSVIGANSVVTKDIPEYSVAVGVPAKVIRKRGKNNGKNKL